MPPSKRSHSEYPILCRIEVLLASEDGEQLGTASGVTIHGTIPTEEDVLDGLKSLPEVLPDGFRLATPAEMYEYICQEKGLGRISVAAPKKWDKQAAIDQAMIDGAEIAAAKDESDDE